MKKLQKEQNDMNSLTERKKDIGRVLKSLVERHKSAGDRLSELKGIVGTPEEPEGIQGEIRELSTDRDFLSEVIEERSKELEDVIARLEPFEEAERIARVKQELIQLARDAEKSCKAYSQAMKVLDSEIMKGVLEIIEQKGKWRKSAVEFAELANTINPCFKQPTYRVATNSDQSEAENLLKELSQSVNVDAVTNGYILNRNHFPMADGSSIGGGANLNFAQTIMQLEHAVLLKMEGEHHGR